MRTATTNLPEPQVKVDIRPERFLSDGVAVG
jgi:hypothetical protein